ncbi:MAG: hypothetical protein AAF211_26645, partial [Myxococcota bacterium]
MLLDEDLLPFAARRAFACLPDSLRAELLDPDARSVMRDWARDHDHPALEAALEARAFFFHAMTLLVERFDHRYGTWPIVVRWDESRASLLLVQEGEIHLDEDEDDDEYDPLAMVEESSRLAIERLADPLWRLGLEGSGRDAILVGPTERTPKPGAWRRITGYVPRR